MKLADLKTILARQPDLHLRFVLSHGAAVPAHAHVTEVARFDKRFVDCGGTLRTDSFCRLQTWVADDIHHRLTAGKLLGILRKAGSVLLSDELEVDVEHDLGAISQSPIEAVEAAGSELIVRLGIRHTACLAEDKCKRPETVESFRSSSIHFEPMAGKL